MSSQIGYFMLVTDLARWLDAAQRQPTTKNKVRKDLWTNFSECIHFYVATHERGNYVRIPRAHFVTLQSFCLADGKGQDTLSNDQLLSFITTCDELRQLVSAELASIRDHDAASQLFVEEVVSEDVEQEQEAPRSATKVKSGKVVRE